MCQQSGMTFRAILLVLSVALLLGSVFLILDSSNLPEAVDAAIKGEPLLLPEGVLLGTAAFFAVFALVGGALFWPIASRIDRQDAARADRIAADLIRFQREGRTRDKARRAEVERARSQWAKDLDGSAADAAARQWAGWSRALLAGFAVAGIAAAWAPEVFPTWLAGRGYAPCATLDESRWVRTRRGRSEVHLSGWAQPQDCPATRE